MEKKKKNGLELAVVTDRINRGELSPDVVVDYVSVAASRILERLDADKCVPALVALKRSGLRDMDRYLGAAPPEAVQALYEFYPDVELLPLTPLGFMMDQASKLCPSELVTLFKRKVKDGVGPPLTQDEAAQLIPQLPAHDERTGDLVWHVFDLLRGHPDAPQLTASMMSTGQRHNALFSGSLAAHPHLLLPEEAVEILNRHLRGRLSLPRYLHDPLFERAFECPKLRPSSDLVVPTSFEGSFLGRYAVLESRLHWSTAPISNLLCNNGWPAEALDEDGNLSRKWLRSVEDGQDSKVASWPASKALAEFSAKQWLGFRAGYAPDVPMELLASFVESCGDMPLGDVTAALVAAV